MNHVLLLEERFFCFTRDDMRILAYQVAEANNIPHRCNREKGMAGGKYYYGLIFFHSEMLLGHHELTSVGRAQGREHMRELFVVFGYIVDNCKLDVIIIVSMEETAFSTVQKPQETLALCEEHHQVYAITGGETGTYITFVCCMSAIGRLHPPMFILKRLRVKQGQSEGAPPGNKFARMVSG